mmetsp:Transcript_75605/g.130902  ORF Transcript_75605/g.130902 Transcript_75605/m.130902 type:complete len:308 (+) Transcript_75605:107-1030(+)
MAELDPEELLEEVFKKTGPELFKELFRLYPIAEVEDYYKNGVWKNEIMKTDIVLFSAHREEAGSPDPMPLEEVKVPNLPEEKKAWTPVSTLGTMGAAKIPGIQSATTATASSVPGGTVAELRLIALFVAKWKLDPTKTKASLAKMTPERRRYVVTNFKTDKFGVEATEQLLKYIDECEKDGKWDKGPSISPGTSPGTSVAGKVVTPKVGTIAPKPGVMTAKPFTVVSPPTLGVKRPWGATATDGNASKWPKMASMVRPPSVTGLRPAAWGAGRPPQVVSAKRPGMPGGMPLARPQMAWNGKSSGKGW